MLHKSNHSNVFWTKNLRSLALHISKALQEPCRNSFLLIVINSRDITSGTVCMQKYRYILLCRGIIHKGACYIKIHYICTKYISCIIKYTLQLETEHRRSEKSYPVKPAPLHGCNASVLSNGKCRARKNRFIGVVLFLFLLYIYNKLSKKTNDWIHMYFRQLYSTFSWNGLWGNMLFLHLFWVVCHKAMMVQMWSKHMFSQW